MNLTSVALSSSKQGMSACTDAHTGVNLVVHWCMSVLEVMPGSCHHALGSCASVQVCLQRSVLCTDLFQTGKSGLALELWAGESLSGCWLGRLCFATKWSSAMNTAENACSRDVCWAVSLVVTQCSTMCQACVLLHSALMAVTRVQLQCLIGVLR